MKNQMHIFMRLQINNALPPKKNLGLSEALDRHSQISLIRIKDYRRGDSYMLYSQKDFCYYQIKLPVHNPDPTFVDISGSNHKLALTYSIHYYVYFLSSD